MRALLYKDFTSAKVSYLLGFLIMLIIGVYAVSRQAYIIIPLLFLYMPIIMNAISFGVDAQVDFPVFVFTSPISRQMYVVSKYIFSIVLAILSFLSCLIVFRLENYDIGLSLIIAALCFGLPIIFSSIQIPFFFKYGVEKGKIIMVAAYFLLFFLSSFLGEYKESVIIKIQEVSQSQPYLIFAFIIGFTLVILCLSIRAGIQILNKKEF